MRFTEQELQRRTPVWLALSDLFLDTELQEYDHRSIARSLLDSGFSENELAEILWTEVYPDCIGNLGPWYPTVGGEWGGFAEGWLVGQILATPRRWWRRCRFFQPHRRMIQDDWAKIMRYVSESRRTGERPRFGP